jgi:hypothetical protein
MSYSYPLGPESLPAPKELLQQPLNRLRALGAKIIDLTRNRLRHQTQEIGDAALMMTASTEPEEPEEPPINEESGGISNAEAIRLRKLQAAEENEAYRRRREQEAIVRQIKNSGASSVTPKKT